MNHHLKSGKIPYDDLQLRATCVKGERDKDILLTAPSLCVRDIKFYIVALELKLDLATRISDLCWGSKMI